MKAPRCAIGCDIEDAVDGLVAVAERGAGGEAYNICGSREMSVGALVNLIVKIMIERKLISGVKLKKIPGGALSQHIRMQPYDTLNVIRVKPTTQLAEGLEQTITAFLAANPKYGDLSCNNP